MSYEDESKKKDLPCLRCGKIIFTQIYRRICPDCKKTNKDARGMKGRVLTGQRTAKQSKFKED